MVQEIVPQINFNSIKVRLKRPIVLAFNPRISSFQFHKGTIKTQIFDLRRYFSSEFQFHKGTIKTSAFLSTTFQFFYFNSIKVRLKLEKQFNNDKWVWDFNSIKVRLKHSIVSKYRAYTLFQFHKGTIKTSSWRFTAAQ